MEEKDEEFGTIIVDGKIINLDKAKPEELENIRKKLEQKEAELKAKIDKLLFEDDDE